MDCVVCSVVPVNLRPPRNIICSTCSESAREILNLINTNNVVDDDHNLRTKVLMDHKAGISLVSAQNPSKGLVVALKWVKDMKVAEKESNETIEFLRSFAASFRDQIHTDIFINSGQNGVPIAAHKALLATKSQVLKHMFDSDECKAPPNNITTLEEFNHEQLESFLEFLYIGSLPFEKLNKHIYALSVAAEKYGISYLQTSCEKEKHMMSNLNTTNALDVLEIADLCSGLRLLKDVALRFVVDHMEEIVFSDRFETFALKNPHLSLQITRASFFDTKNRANLS